MFEREVMISSLKKQSADLKRLVAEMEEKPRHGWQDTQYFHETLKKIETALRRMRRAGEDAPLHESMGAKFKYYTHPFTVREMS